MDSARVIEPPKKVVVPKKPSEAPASRRPKRRLMPGPLPGPAVVPAASQDRCKAVEDLPFDKMPNNGGLTSDIVMEDLPSNGLEIDSGRNERAAFDAAAPFDR